MVQTEAFEMLNRMVSMWRVENTYLFLKRFMFIF